MNNHDIAINKLFLQDLAKHGAIINFSLSGLSLSAKDYCEVVSEQLIDLNNEGWVKYNAEVT